MEMARRGACGALALVALLGSGSVWAETPAARAVQRKATEERVVILEDRLAGLHPDGLVAETSAAAAKRSLELARKALGRQDGQAARFFADRAAHALEQATPPEVTQ
jgi:hypothetical protein